MSDMTPLVVTEEFRQPAVGTAGNDTAEVACLAPFAGAVSAVRYIPDVAITGADTNTRKHELVNETDSDNLVASLQYNSGVNAAQYAAKSLTLNATVGYRGVAEGDVLVFKSTHLANGITDPGGLVQIEFTRS